MSPRRKEREESEKEGESEEEEGGERRRREGLRESQQPLSERATNEGRPGRCTKLDLGKVLGTLEGLGRGYGSPPKGSGFDLFLEENGC